MCRRAAGPQVVQNTRGSEKRSDFYLFVFPFLDVAVSRRNANNHLPLAPLPEQVYDEERDEERTTRGEHGDGAGGEVQVACHKAGMGEEAG